MKLGNISEADDVVFYGVTEEGIVKFLENQLKCLEEEYEMEIVLADSTEGKERRLGIDYTGMGAGRKQAVDLVMQSLLPAILSYGQKQYVEQQMQLKRHLSVNEDPLTGMFSSNYLMNRAFVLNRAEIYPTTVIAVKLKHWKNVAERYGKESGDSLIQLAASILASTAEKDYLIGRMNDDTFVVLIPLVKPGETEAYCKRVDEECRLYKDSDFSPVFAMGIAATQNKTDEVQQKIKEAMEQLPQ